MKHLLIISIVLTSLVANADEVKAAGTLKCKVISVSNASSQMFALNQVPAVDETISINKDSNVITELNFSNGGRIPLKNIGARLVRHPLLPNGIKHFEGVATSNTSNYTGVLVIYPDRGEVTYVNFQALRKAFGGITAPLMELFDMQMECTR